MTGEYGNVPEEDFITKALSQEGRLAVPSEAANKHLVWYRFTFLKSRVALPGKH